MKRSKFTEQQIAFALQQAESGTQVAEVCRKMGISEATFYRWKQLYGGLMPSEVKKLRQLEEENGRLRKVVADLTLDKEMREGVARPKLGPAAGGRGWSLSAGVVLWGPPRPPARAVPACRATYHYRPRRPEQAPLRKRIREIAETRMRYGYRRITVLLRREGW